MAWYIWEDHVPIFSRKMWDEAQAELKEKRDYLATVSVVGELDDESYKNKV